MTFPTIPTVGAGRVVTGVQADTTATRTFPSLSGLTKNSGDLLVAIVIGYQGSLTANIWGSWGGGFSEQKDIGVATQHNVGIATKISDGTETGTFTVTQAATITGHAVFILLSIPGANTSTAIAVSAALATGTSAAADPAALAPSWGAEDTLWIAVRGSGETATTGSFTGLSTPPTNYTNSAQTGISSDVVGGVEGGTSFRQNNTSSEDVPAGTCDTSNARNMAIVIAVRPATPPVFGQAKADIKAIGRGFGQAVTYVSGLASVIDTFTRSVTDGFGTADTGGAWTVFDAVADYDVTGTEGSITLQDTISNRRAALLKTALYNQEVVIKFKVPRLPTSGAFYKLQLRLRYWADSAYLSGAYYDVACKIASTGELQVIAGGGGSYATSFTGIISTPGDYVYLKGSVYQSSSEVLVSSRAWISTAVEPESWYIQHSVPVSANFQLVPGWVGIAVDYESGDTGSFPTTVFFDDLNVRNNYTPTANSYAQANIKAVTKVFAQAQADIKAIQKVFGQAQTRVYGPDFISYAGNAGGPLTTLGATPAVSAAIKDVIYVSLYLNGDLVTSVTDNLGNTYTQNIKTTLANGKVLYTYTAISIAAGSLTVTANFTSSDILIEAVIYRPEPLAPVWLLPFTTASSIGTSATAATSALSHGFLGTGIVVSNVGSTLGASPYSVDSSFQKSPFDNTYTTVSSSEEDALLYSPSVTPTFTLNTSAGWGINAISFQPAGLGFGQAQAKILSFKGSFGQAQAKIKAFGVKSYSQAQADIKQTYPLGGTRLFYDTFTRSLTDSWGTADIGGSWTLSGTAADFDVNGSKGTITLGATGSNRNGLLNSVSQLNQDIQYNLAADKLAVGTGAVATYHDIIARYIDVNNFYFLRIFIEKDARLGLGIYKFAGTTTNLTTVTYPATYVAGDIYWVRFQVTGTNPTTLSGKFWKVGDAEPAFMHTTTDSTAALQAAGAVGLRTQWDTITNNPIVVTNDDLQDLTAPASVPEADTYAQAQAKIQSPIRVYAQAQALIVNACYFNTVKTDSPVGYWRLGESSGATAVDEMGSHNGTYAGTPTYGQTSLISGDSNTSVNFVRANGSEVSMTGSTWWAGGADITLETWADFLTPNGTDNRTIGGLRAVDDAPNAFLMSYLLGGAIEVRFRNSAGTAFDITSAVVSVATHYVVLVKSGVNLTLYIDGVSAGTRSDLTGSITGSEPTYIGRGGTFSGNAQNYNGRIDEFAVYDKALTLSQIQTHYASRTVACSAVTTRAYGQAQADIKATSKVFAQANADIKAVGRGFGQANTDIKAIQKVFAQAQTDIKAIQQVYGQANVDIKAVSKVFAQAQSDIKTTSNVFAQSQADIKATSNAFAQANSDIKNQATNYSNPYAQANADIKAITKVYGQAQADIKVTSQVYAQSQAQIIKTSQVYAQAQADIKAVDREFGQANTDIKAIGRGLGQTQTDIKATANVFAQAQASVKGNAFGQAQADIKQVYQGYGQSQANIKATSNTFAQSQTDIKATSNVFAQANSDIKAISWGFAQAQAEVKQTYQSFAQSQAEIKQTYNQFAQAQTCVKGNAFAQAQVDIKQIYQGYAQAQSDIKATYQGYGQANTDIKATSNAFAQANADIKAITKVFAQAQADIKQIYQAFAQAQVDIKQTYNSFAQAQADIKATSVVCGQAQADVKATSNAFGQAQADIKTTYKVFAQAQADIKVTTNQVAQAQVSIKQTYNAFAQANTDIKATNQAYAQAQAKLNAFGVQAYAQALSNVKGIDIEGVGQAQAKINAFGVQGYGQAQGDIKSVSYGFGQAQCSVINTYFGFAQAQADILKITYSFAQANVDVKATSQVYSQAQAEIKQTYQSYAQAQADIKATTNNCGQAQAEIKTTYNSFGQAQADIKQIYYAFAQANVEIKQTYSVFAQSQTDIKVTTNVFAQAQGDIKSTYSVFAQAQTDIKATSNAYGQAQCTVRGNAFGQTQADIKQVYFGFAQAQAQSKQTYNAFAQSQAEIKQTYQAYAQANADIKATSQGFGQANADIKVTTNQFAQAQADILVTNIVCAQAQADIKQIYQGYAQAQADIKAAGYGFGQANADINATSQAYAQAQAYIKTEAIQAYAQAQAEIKTTYQSYAQANARVIAFGVQAYAQAQTNIRFNGNTVSAQAQAKINAFDYPQHGQALASIKSVYNVSGQAQADILASYTAFVQAQADILQTYQGYGQSQADIKQTYQGYGQANALIVVTGNNQSGNAQANIKNTYYGFAQATVDIKAVTNSCGQAQADIKATNQAYAQAQTDVKAVGYGFGQANTDIKAISNGYGQAQADIRVTTYQFAQTNVYIRLTNQAYGQANAQIISGHFAFANAQALISQTVVKCANAQALIRTSVITVAQAESLIRTVNIVNGQANADVKRTTRVFAQSQALIVTNVNVSGQAQTLIIKSAGYGQALAYILQLHELCYIDLNDEHSITVTLDDEIDAIIIELESEEPIEVELGQEKITVILNDEHTFILQLDDKPCKGDNIGDC